MTNCLKSQVLHYVEVEVDLLEVNQATTMGFSKTKVAKILGISWKTLHSKTVGQSGETSGKTVRRKSVLW